MFNSASQVKRSCLFFRLQHPTSSSRLIKAKMCLVATVLNCFVVNKPCPLSSRLRRAHQSQTWPCIPGEVWINELWTSKAKVTSHQSLKPTWTNLHRTKNRRINKNPHEARRTSRFEARGQGVGVTSAETAERERQRSSNYHVCGREEALPPLNKPDGTGLPFTHVKSLQSN